MALLFLVRHGQASFGSADYDRLSELGRQQSRWLGEHFAGRGLQFRRVVAGSLRRQQSTAEEILAAMQPRWRPGAGDPGAAGAAGASADVQAQGDTAGRSRVSGSATGMTTTIDTHAGLNEYSGEALYAAHTKGRDPLTHQQGDYRDYWRTLKAAMHAWAADELTGVPETWSAFGARTHAALTFACQGLGRDDNVLVVSSGGAISRAVIDIIGSPGATAVEFNLQFRNTGVCELIVGGDAAQPHFRLVTFNTLPHLEHPERRASITFA